jgi:transcriptional regulator with XRE-family HTH domain
MCFILEIMGGSISEETIRRERLYHLDSYPFPVYFGTWEEARSSLLDLLKLNHLSRRKLANKVGKSRQAIDHFLSEGSHPTSERRLYGVYDALFDIMRNNEVFFDLQILRVFFQERVVIPKEFKDREPEFPTIIFYSADPATLMEPHYWRFMVEPLPLPGSYAKIPTYRIR